MKTGYRLLFSLYVSFFVYSLLFFIWRSSGLIETTRLVNHRDKLSHNTKILSELNNKLDVQFDRLRSDSDLISLKARDLGFLKKGEGSIVLNGFKRSGISYSVGSYYKKFQSDTAPVNNFRIFALISGILTFLIMTLIKGNYNAHQRKFTLTN